MLEIKHPSVIQLINSSVRSCGRSLQEPVIFQCRKGSNQSTVSELFYHTCATDLIIQGVDEYVDPAQSTPKERFVLRAAGSRPYGSDGKAGSIQRTAHLRELRVDILVDPYRALRRTGSIFHSSNDTPSVSPFGLPAPPEVEPRALCAWRIHLDYPETHRPHCISMVLPSLVNRPGSQQVINT